MARTPVILNVYNMYWLNEYTQNIGLGVYHSGVEVYDKEYAFSGHPFDFTGVFDMLPKDAEDLGEGLTLRDTIILGYTDFLESEVKKIINMLGEQYTGSSYHLIKKNCNHFTNDLSKVLCGKPIPGWVNRLAGIGLRFPFLVSCIPKEWITPEGGNTSLSAVDLTEWEEIDYPTQEEFNISNSTSIIPSNIQSFNNDGSESNTKLTQRIISDS